MKKLILLAFFILSLIAKDNFVFDGIVSKKDLKKAISKTEKKLKKIDMVLKKAEENRWLINKNIKNLEAIKNNSQRIDKITTSLESIKNALYAIKNKKNVTKIIVPQSKQTNTQTLKADFKKLDIELESLMKRVSKLERIKGKNIQTKEESSPILFKFFEYYVIATVVLLLIMFILIFSLTSKVRNLQYELEKLSSKKTKKTNT
jgi:hypothetical protein